MRKTLALVLLAFPMLSLACPMCNIHNYMASSIWESKGIVHGVVVHKEKYEARILVLESLLGSYPVGETIDWSGVYVEKGDTAIFCDIPPGQVGVSFDIYESNVKEEIKFLLRKDTLPCNLEEARVCLTGISGASVMAGIRYFKLHPAEGRTHIPMFIDSLLLVAERGMNTRYADWTLGNLCEAWFASDELLDKASLFSLLDRSFEGADAEIKTKMQYSPAHEAGFLYRQLLQYSADQPSLHTRIKKQFLSQLETANGRVASNIVFALVHERSLSPEEWKSVKAIGKNDAVASGCLRAASFAGSYWQWEDAEAFLQKAKECTPSNKLDAWIADMEESIQRWTKH